MAKPYQAIGFNQFGLGKDFLEVLRSGVIVRI
jgi:hypothetical protein